MELTTIYREVALPQKKDVSPERRKLRRIENCTYKEMGGESKGMTQKLRKSLCMQKYEQIK